MKAKIENAKKEVGGVACWQVVVLDVFVKAYEQAVKEAEGKRRNDAGQFESELAKRRAIEEKMRKVGRLLACCLDCSSHNGQTYIVVVI